MRSITFVLTGILILLALCRTSGRAQEKGFGLGIVMGEPTGVSMKGWTTETNAIDAGVAWSFRSASSFHLHADYLWHNYGVFRTAERIPLYYGIGGRVKIGRQGEDTRFGIRVVVGVDYEARSAPVDVFLELAPVMDLTPGTELTANGGLGVRFWFR